MDNQKVKIKRGKNLVALYAVFILPMAAFGYITTHGIHASPLSNGSVDLLIPSTDYKVGDSIRFQVVNSTAQPISIDNHCPDVPLIVEKYVSNKWVQQHDNRADNNCAGQDRHIIVAPGTTQPGIYDPWKSLFKTPGKYRITLNIEGQDLSVSKEINIVE